MPMCFFFFFFQAEDGIRDGTVTGVKTCALPILALAGGDLHGYAILKEVELRTGGKVRLSTGTLYGIIKRLLNDGLIVELRSRPAESEDDERRRYYRLTPQGRQVATAEAERMDEILSVARSRNLLKKARLV